MRPISSRLLLLCALALALVVPALGVPSLVAPREAAAQGDPRVEARTRYQAGMSKFNAGEYDAAVVEFRAAEQLAPSPLNHYNIALALERKGDAAGAIDAYRAYLDRLPNAANRGDVEASIKRLTPAASAQAEVAARDKAAAEAEAQRQLAAQQAEQAAAESKRRAELEAATRPLPPNGADPAAPTGDPELDRVASVDLNAMRGAQPLPPPSSAATPPTSSGGAAAGAAAPVGDGPKKSSSRPFYKSPVFWVLAAVGVYVLIVLADDSSDSSGNARLTLPEGSPRMSSGPTVFSF